MQNEELKILLSDLRVYFANFVKYKRNLMNAGDRK